jgi:uncharacterized protein YeaO (DUF488 family)
MLKAIADVSVPAPTRMSVERVWYRLNEDRLKVSAWEHACHFPPNERMRAFKQFLQEAFKRETPEYQKEMQAQRDAIYAEELEAWKTRNQWDGSNEAMNVYVYS